MEQWMLERGYEIKRKYYRPSYEITVQPVKGRSIDKYTKAELTSSLVKDPKIGTK